MKLLQKILSAAVAAAMLLLLGGCSKEPADPNRISFEQGSNVLSADTGTVELLLPEPINLNGNGLFKLTLKNTSDAEKLTVAFITEENGDYQDFKSFDIPLNDTKDGTVSADASGSYGWQGHLTGLKITAHGLTEGKITLKTAAVEPGGEHYLSGLTFSDPYVYLSTRNRIGVKKLDSGPDGLLGSWRDEEGKLHFIGSASVGGVSGFFVSDGTPEDPLNTIRTPATRVSGVDWSEFGYCSIAQVVKEPSTGMLIGITHLERFDRGFYLASLGLSTSTDNGQSWQFLGEIICPDIIPGSDIPEKSRDVSNGALMMDGEYLYLYIMDWHEDLTGGTAVCRIKLTELYEKTLAGQVPKAYKYYNGAWEEPGWGGSFTNILPEGLTPNFQCVTYNKVLDKYLMVLCQFAYYDTNDGDLLVLVSDDPVDWRNAQQQWLVTGSLGEQYPTIVSMEENPQLESGAEFYIYWCRWDCRDDNGDFDWRLLWASTDYMCCKVTVTG